MDGSSSSNGYDRLKSCKFGASIGHMDFAGSMNSYNQGFMNGVKDK